MSAKFENEECKKTNEDEIMDQTSHLRGYLHFSYYHAVLILGSILTYLADITLDTVVALSYFRNGEYWYCAITSCLVLFPTIFVQIFSIRWLLMDLDEPRKGLSKREIGIHAALLGVVYRYVEVLQFGLKAKYSKDPVDYQRYYQKQSDVSMLRLFDSFTESAPQLVFHLYVLFVKSQWEVGLATWTGFSALASLISLGSGVASYSSAMRMIQSGKNKMTWTGMILQTAWRFGMLMSRIVALVLLTAALHRWALIIFLVHWMVMTAWIIWQETDFCSTLWEERFYNAIVGVIYCFCFFNLKEGRSRYRATIFYCIIIVENFGFVGIFLWLTEHHWIGIGSLILVSCGTLIGISSMLLYYGFFHPTGPIKLCVERESYDLEKCNGNDNLELSKGPDFVIQENSKMASPLHKEQKKEENQVVKEPIPPAPPPRRRVQHSRSFKNPCPPKQRFSPMRRNQHEVTTNHEDEDKLDSAYGTDSNRTFSRNSVSPVAVVSSEHTKPPALSPLSSLSSLNNNETYMSIEKTSPMAASTVLEDKPSNEASYISVHPGTESKNNTYMSVSTPISAPHSSQDSIVSNESKITVIDQRSSRTPEKSNQNPEKLLKRSPIVKDITSGFAQISPTDTVVNKRLKKNRNPMTIIIPSLPLEISKSSNANNRSDSSDEVLSAHDYENMALVNINRCTGGVRHWKTYSDMNDEEHDDSISTDRNKFSNTTSSSDYETMQNNNNNPPPSLHHHQNYYDVYFPLSKTLKDQLVRNLTPSESDTYEPIEVLGQMKNEEESKEEEEEDPDYELKVPVPVTLIHHDGDRLTTRRVISMENLKEVISNHEKVPMDDPQDRCDLYLLAPMRILEPILEESEEDDNRSLMTVLSDFLNKTYQSVSCKSNQYPYFYFDAGRRETSSSETSGSSSLVHTIEEIRNQSLGNLYYPASNAEKGKKTELPPKPGNNRISKPELPSKSGSSLPPNPDRSKKIPLSMSVGSRKNILDLAGGDANTADILNTPNKRTPEKRESPRNLTLSPSAKYDENNTPTPPPGTFSRNVQNRAPCRRKFSIIRERYENDDNEDENSYRNKSTALRPDEKYENYNNTRGHWTSASLTIKNQWNRRNNGGRRSVSILDIDKENCYPLPPVPRRPIAPKPNDVGFGSLSPNSRIFTQHV